MAAAVALAATVAAAERNPVRRHPHAGVAAAGTQHIIVKLRAPPAAPGAVARSAHTRLAALASRSGLSLESYRSITADLHVVHVTATAGSSSAPQMLARLRTDPEVQYAELDQRRFIHALPNDPLYPSTASSSGQWYFMPSSSTTPSAIDAQTAWSTTTGSAGIVIADIDTGVRFDHPDLGSVSSGGRMLPGYCFISDPFIANNGTCPGPDASDPGDWVSSQDLSAADCVDAGVTQLEDSSWHGTRVAGLLGAIANNSIGIAGATWSGRVLPVRALGVCGGQDSDIISGMLWAAGITVSGAPANTTPAKIINLSLGGSGACPQTYQDAIDQITDLGVLIVVSAGNESGPVDAPANCQGVAGIAGLRHIGTKVGYSNDGPQLALAAPAGNCVNTTAGEPCVYPITTTTNLGTTTPGTNDYTGLYACGGQTGIASSANCTVTSTQYRTYNLGTSFSAPQVSGIGALMAAVNPKLNSCQLISRLKESALPFPQSSPTTTAICPSLDPTSDECICTNDGQTCGAGMANASGAVAAALRPIAAVAVPGTVTAGQMVQLKGSGSAAAANHMLTAFGWSNAGGQTVTIQNGNTATATVSLPACGFATVALTVTDDAGRTDTAQVVLTPSSASTSAPAAAGQTSCPLTTPAIEIAVCPASASVRASGGMQAFTASLANTADSSVTWEVNGIEGGNAMLGTISTTGVYTAPTSVPSGGSVIVTAVAAADAGATASAALNVTAPPGSGGGGGGGSLDLRTLAALLALWVWRAAARSLRMRPRRPATPAVHSLVRSSASGLAH